MIVPGRDLTRLTDHGARVLDTLAAPTQGELADELKGNAARLTRAQKRLAKPPATKAGDRAFPVSRAACLPPGR